jgi:hypothetical protein
MIVARVGLVANLLLSSLRNLLEFEIRLVSKRVHRIGFTTERRRGSNAGMHNDGVGWRSKGDIRKFAFA